MICSYSLSFSLERLIFHNWKEWNPIKLAPLVHSHVSLTHDDWRWWCVHEKYQKKEKPNTRKPKNESIQIFKIRKCFICAYWKWPREAVQLCEQRVCVRRERERKENDDGQIHLLSMWLNWSHRINKKWECDVKKMTTMWVRENIFFILCTISCCCCVKKSS